MRKHCLSQYGVIRDGEWELIRRYDEYLAIHKCEKGAFSWESGPRWTATNPNGGGCMACGKSPPDTMQGFMKLLEWER
jgi:hypothetical protein